MTRIQFLPRRLDYLCSIDVQVVGGGSTVGAGESPDVNSDAANAVRVNRATEKDTPPSVYNALSETRAAGQDAIKGRVVFSEAVLVYPSDCEFANLSCRLVLSTSDNRTIRCTMDGVVRSHLHWDMVRMPDDPGTEVKAHVAARFHTSASKYQWLVQQQCVGYGRMTLLRGKPGDATFDIYRLSVPIQ
jgi:Protein of unknown function (DUF3237)